MKQIKVLGLPNCNWCESLVENLNDAEIPYTFVDVNKNGALADQLEDFLQTDLYPIVLIEDGAIVYYLSRPNDAERLGRNILPNGDMAIGYYSIEALMTEMDYILKK